VFLPDAGLKKSGFLSGKTSNPVPGTEGEWGEREKFFLRLEKVFSNKGLTNENRCDIFKIYFSKRLTFWKQLSFFQLLNIVKNR
jgi:hypothetical protein